MSTTFGVYIGSEEVDYTDDMLSPEQFPMDDKEDQFVEVACRTNGGTVYWANDLAPLLPLDLNVYALDNTAQGIYTIGDIHSAIRNYIQNRKDN